MLECKILTSKAEIEAIAGEWRELFARAGRSTVTDYDRFHGWWNTIGESSGTRSLHVVTGREGGKLVGVLPLSVECRNRQRILQADGALAFESCEILCESKEQAAALWQAAYRSRHYDFANMLGVYSGSVCADALASFAHRRGSAESFGLRIQWPTGKDWLASLSGNTRGNFRRCVRRLEEKGAVRYEAYETGPVPAEIVEAMVRQKIAWSAINGKHGLFDQSRVLPFFHKQTEVAAAQGRLFLSWLACGPDVIAYNQGFIHQGVLYLYFWTYDPAWSAYSPGNVLMVNSICRAVDGGLKYIDFMRTTDSASEKYFKVKYSNEKQDCYEFTFSRSLRGRLLETAFVVRKSSRLVLQKLRKRSKKQADPVSQG